MLGSKVQINGQMRYLNDKNGRVGGSHAKDVVPQQGLLSLLRNIQEAVHKPVPQDVITAGFNYRLQITGVTNPSAPQANFEVQVFACFLEGMWGNPGSWLDGRETEGMTGIMTSKDSFCILDCRKDRFSKAFCKQTGFRTRQVSTTLSKTKAISLIFLIW